MRTNEFTAETRRRRGKCKHDRDGGHDCVELMELARIDASVLEVALGAMGFTEADDNFPDDE
jgi:hypothetical protein